MSVSAIIVAAGRGTRLAHETPKAFLPLGGKPLFTYALATFAQVPDISEVLLVVAGERIAATQELLAQYLPGSPVKVVAGGAERQDSVANGVAAAAGTYLAIHDAARPFVSTAVITRCIATARQHGAAIAAVPAHDTLKRVNHGRIQATIDRSQIWLAQTPQVASREWLVQAIERVRRDAYVATDEAGMLEHCGFEVRVVEGEAGNRKITTPDDLRWAEWVVAASSPPRGAMRSSTPR